MIGDPALYACAGDAADRRRRRRDGDGVTVTVLGARRTRPHRRLVGASDRGSRVGARDRDARRSKPTHDAATGAWELELDVSEAGWVKLHIAAIP